MKLSIIVVNWNTCSLLRACLLSLRRHPAAGGQELVVVDNGSSDGSAEMVRREFPEVLLIANAKNTGYAAANNQGLRAASGDFLLLLNSDTEVLAGALDTLVEVLETHPEAGAAAPRLVWPDGRVQPSVRGFPAPGALLAEVTGLARLFPRSRSLGAYRMRWWDYDDEREVDQPMTSCLLIRRAALEQVGLLDEAFPIFFNDVDWCFRARQLGWRIRFTPRAEVLHYLGATTSKRRGAMLLESGRSLARFYRKHYRGRTFLPLYAASLLAIHLGTWGRYALFSLRPPRRTASAPAVETPQHAVKGGEAPPAGEKPDVVVSIVNWNTRDDLAACLRALYDNNPPPPTFVAAVVDNASSDGSADMVAERFPAAVVVRNADNRGFAAANNQVMKSANGRYVFLLNPDAETHPGALAALVRFMDENPDVGVCGPLVLNPDGSVQYSARRFPTLLAGAFRNTFLTRLFPNNRYNREYLLSDWDHRSQRDVDWLSGAAMFIRQEVIEQIGVLDEQFFMYSEDVDFCYRAGQAGWRITFFPGAAVTHARAHSSDQAQGKMLVQFHRSMYRFWRKHYAPRTPWLLRLLVPPAIMARAGLLLAKNMTDRVRKRLSR